MAQKKSASSSRGGQTAKKRPSSGARAGAGTKKKTAGSASSTRSRSGSGAQTSRKAAPPEPPRRPIRRQAGAVLLLFLGLVALIALFPAEGWLIESWRTLVRGLLGWGYYVMPAALLWGAFVLASHRGRPVQARLICTLLLPMAFGALVHVLTFTREGIFGLGFGGGVKLLWQLSKDAGEHSAGVLGGMVAIALRKSLGAVGGTLVLLVAHVLMLLKAVDVPALALWDKYKNRPRLAYAPEDYKDDGEPDEDDFFSPEDYLFPLREKEPVHARREAPAKPRSKAPVKPVHRQLYDEDWEQQKDYIFSEMDVDPSATVRVAEALRAEREQLLTQEPRPAEKKPAPAAKPKKSRASSIDIALDDDVKPEVEPLSLEEAADIAGVEIQSADMDAGAASPAPAEKIKIDKDAEAAIVAADIAAGEAEDKAEYIFPSMELLNKSTGSDNDTEENLDETQAQLESAIRSFGVGASIVGAIHGPSITRYELKLEQGVKLNKITNLAGDIALSLGVTSVRIAPIPDKISTVGVEVPNRHVKTVWLGDVIDSKMFKDAKSKLSVAMGKDIGGNVIVGNIAKMPHVLIAGTTGSGKSVCINSLILSLLYKSTPDEVRMIMIDPKMVELGIYNGMPHLYVPVVTDPKKAAGALQWSVVEMLKRYRLFSEEGVRDLAGYNAILKSRDEPALPQVVIIIDELADLMMVASKEVEESICRVAQMGRAAGMHLVVATQRPSADVITGLMKANIPSRIAFAVSSSLESRIILDQQGAEKLVGAGDMLYSPIGVGKPVRVQGAFVTDEEREEIINFVKREAEAEYSDEIMAEMEKAAVDKSEKGGDSKEADKPQNDYDELLPQAVEVIFETKQASVSMLQRRLKLGYSRAARLIDQLEEVGVVGPYEGSKPRQIMLTKQQWQEMQYSQGTAPVDTIAQEFAQVSENEDFAEPAEETAHGETALTTEEDYGAEPEEDMPWQEDDDI